jgi:hypothetical protein
MIVASKTASIMFEGYSPNDIFCNPRFLNCNYCAGFNAVPKIRPGRLSSSK